MNIVVAMKQVPDLQQVRIRDRKPVLDEVSLTLSNIDKNALQAGVQIRDIVGGKVIILSAGPETVEDTIKEGLAADGDEAYLIIDDALAEADSEEIARVLACAIKQMQDVSIILFGEGSADNYSGQVGSRVAELLNIPEAGCAKAIEIIGNKAVVTRSLEDCEEVIEVGLPAVITVVSEINEAPIPSVTKILKAGKKSKTIVELSDLDLNEKQKMNCIMVSNLAPESSRKHVVVKQVEELAEIIKKERR